MSSDSNKSTRRKRSKKTTTQKSKSSKKASPSAASGEVVQAELVDEAEDDVEPIVVPPEEVIVEDVGPSPKVDDKLPIEPAKTTSAITHYDPLAAYMREVQRHPLLSPEEEHELAVRYHETGDIEAATKLVSANLRLVIKIAYEYRRAYRNIMDLIQEGNIGLMQAVKRYDPYRGVKLSSYAAWWIRAYILRFILNNWRLVKLGTTQAQRKLFFNLNKEKARLAAMGIEPTSAEIAKRLSVDEQEVVEMDRRLASREASLDAPVGDTDGRSVSRVELLPASDEGPDKVTAETQFQNIVRKHMAEFRKTLTNPKEITIFDERLVADEPLTLQEIGKRYGVSRERARQIEARLIKHLREYLREKMGDDFDAATW